MWILYGLGLAVVSRARLAARERAGSAGKTSNVPAPAVEDEDAGAPAETRA
jgi:hypothetical protein